MIKRPSGQGWARTQGALALIALTALAAPRIQAQSRTPNLSAAIATKETVLRDVLFQMRVAVDKYHAVTGQYPHSLEALVSEGYVSQIPTDPMPNRTAS